jgi:hypothetical protein
MSMHRDRTRDWHRTGKHNVNRKRDPGQERKRTWKRDPGRERKPDGNRKEKRDRGRSRNTSMNLEADVNTPGNPDKKRNGIRDRGRQQKATRHQDQRQETTRHQDQRQETTRHQDRRDPRAPLPPPAGSTQTASISTETYAMPWSITRGNPIRVVPAG